MNSKTFSYMTAKIIFPQMFNFFNLCRFAGASRQSRSGPENVHGGAEKETKARTTTKMGSRGSDTSPRRDAV